MDRLKMESANMADTIVAEVDIIIEFAGKPTPSGARFSL